ncbi:hypothetical protein VKT23_012479 [Stygiomarasmius scandens]|uniref:BTB domain-containing protein n=1 Tax=Marasmiellus scandens TaxID=2682957 RepID=A0ABR1J9J0_9AGAR
MDSFGFLWEDWIQDPSMLPGPSTSTSPSTGPTNHLEFPETPVMSAVNSYQEQDNPNATKVATRGVPGFKSLSLSTAFQPLLSFPTSPTTTPLSPQSSTPTTPSVSSPTPSLFSLPQTPAETATDPIINLNARKDFPSPDIILISSDSVVFYVNQYYLLAPRASTAGPSNASSSAKGKGKEKPVPTPTWSTQSTNSFSSLLPITTPNKTQRVLPLPISSPLLNVFLHILYSADPSAYLPSLPLLTEAVDLLPKYGYAAKEVLIEGHPVYTLLLTRYSPIYPLEIYSTAAHHTIHPLAQASSSHLLSLDLSTLTDVDADRMGSVYLAKLFHLHRKRREDLCRELMPPPGMHNPTRDCGFNEQRRGMGRAWTVGAAWVSWCAKADTPPNTIRSIFKSITNHITCEECLKGRDERLGRVVVGWSMAKRTI